MAHSSEEQPPLTAKYPLAIGNWGETAAVSSIERAWNTILELGYRPADLYSEENEILVSTDQLVELFIKYL